MRHEFFRSPRVGTMLSPRPQLINSADAFPTFTLQPLPSIVYPPPPPGFHMAQKPQPGWWIYKK